jgi:hypothetical protein
MSAIPADRSSAQPFILAITQLSDDCVPEAGVHGPIPVRLDENQFRKPGSN